MKKLIFIFILFLCYSFCQIIPGAKATISSQGFEYARQTGYKLLVKFVEGRVIEIPFVDGNTSIPIIGRIFFNLTNLKVSDVQISEPTFSLIPDEGVSLSLIHVVANFKGDYKYWGAMTGTGNLNCQLKRMQFDIAVKLTSLRNEGYPLIEIMRLNFKILEWDLSINGPGWFLKFLIWLFNGTIKGQIEKGVIQGVRDAVSKEINPQLEKLPLLERVYGPLGLDSRLTSIVINQHLLSIQSKAGVFNMDTGKQPIYPRRPIADTTTNSKMVMIMLSEFLPNSLAEMANHAGLLKVNVTDSMLPQWSPLRLNTSSFSTLLPNLQRLYPNKLLLLETAAAETPKLDFQKDASGLVISSLFDMKWFAIDGSNYHHAFTLTTRISMLVKILLRENAINHTIVQGEVSRAGIGFSVKESSIGNINLADFEQMINLSINMIVLPIVNTLLSREIPSMFELVRLSKAHVQVEDHYIGIAADLMYDGPD